MQKSYQKSVVVNHNDNGVDLMNSAYTNTNDLFKETLDLTKDLACKVEQANEKVMKALLQKTFLQKLLLLKKNLLLWNKSLL